MKIPALVLSAARLSGLGSNRLARDIGINRSLLSRSLAQASIPDRHFRPLCAAVGVAPTGERWDGTYVGRWFLFPPNKRGSPATAQDLATAYAALQNPHVLRVSRDLLPRSAEEFRLHAIAQAKPGGNTESWCVYIVAADGVRRLLYIEPPLRKAAELILSGGGKFDSFELSNNNQSEMGFLFAQFTTIVLPDELDALIKRIRFGRTQDMLLPAQIELIKQAAEVGNQTVAELQHLLAHSKLLDDK